MPSERELDRIARLIREKDLKCPRCEYPLRGLRTAQCPECGFGYDADSLLAESGWTRWDRLCLLIPPVALCVFNWALVLIAHFPPGPIGFEIFTETVRGSLLWILAMVVTRLVSGWRGVEDWIEQQGGAILLAASVLSYLFWLFETPK